MNSRIDPIFLAEDNPGDVFLIREMMQAHKIPNEIYLFRDGEAAIRHIEEADKDDLAAAPALCLLDLDLPKNSGHEVLQRLRASRKFNSTPVIVLTSSDSPRDRAEAIQLGANWYIRKPTSLDRFMAIGEVVNHLLLGQARQLA